MVVVIATTWPRPSTMLMCEVPYSTCSGMGANDVGALGGPAGLRTCACGPRADRRARAGPGRRARAGWPSRPPGGARSRDRRRTAARSAKARRAASVYRCSQSRILARRLRAACPRRALCCQHAEDLPDRDRAGARRRHAADAVGPARRRGESKHSGATLASAGSRPGRPVVSSPGLGGCAGPWPTMACAISPLGARPGRASVGDAAQHRRQLRVAQEVADGQRLAVGLEEVGRGHRVVREVRFVLRQQRVQPRAPTGNPCSASAMAGSNSVRPRQLAVLPVRHLQHAHSAPGTPTERPPTTASAQRAGAGRPAPRNSVCVGRGRRGLAAVEGLDVATPSWCSRKAPPPMPLDCGSTSVSTIWTAMAASMAEPPRAQHLRGPRRWPADGPPRRRTRASPSRAWRCSRTAAPARSAAGASCGAAAGRPPRRAASRQELRLGREPRRPAAARAGLLSAAPGGSRRRGGSPRR